MAGGGSLARIFYRGEVKLNTRSSLAGHYGHLFFVNVEVRENVLYVVVFFERFHELEHLLRRGTGKLNIILRNPGDFRRFELNARFRQSLAYSLECVGRSDYFPRGAVVSQILCPGVENDR